MGQPRDGAALAHDGVVRARHREVPVEQVVARSGSPGGRVHLGRDEVERDHLRVRMRDGRAGGAAVVHQRHRVRVAGGDLHPRPITQHPDHLARRVVGQGAERTIVVRRQHHHFVRARVPSPASGPPTMG